MCHSGYCYFEDHYGYCRVKSFNEIKKITGENACYIGGNCMCEEDGYWWGNDYKEGNISRWRKLIIFNELIW